MRVQPAGTARSDTLALCRPLTALILLAPWALAPASCWAGPRSGAWLGGALTSGTLQLRASDANRQPVELDTELSAMPGVVGGFEYWPSDAIGVHLSALFGLGIHVRLPKTFAPRLESAGLEGLQAGDQRFGYQAHQFEGGARYRWFLWPGADAPAIFTGLGFRALRQSVQAQVPAFLVSSTLLGPEVALGGELPLLAGDLWLRATARAHLPFFVRETPADSGDPQSFFGAGGRIEAVYTVLDPLAVQLVGDAVLQSADFRGAGTRLFGVFDSRVDDDLYTLMIVTRYQLE